MTSPTETLTRINKTIEELKEFPLFDEAEMEKATEYPKGLSLLSLKNHVLFSYIQHLVRYLSIKLDEHQTLAENEQLVRHLIKHRVVLEKMAPLELKLRYQIEKLVSKADKADQAGEADSEEDAGDLAMDPLAFKPNPSNLVLDDKPRRRNEQDDESDDSNSEGGSKPYRPPKVSAMPFLDKPKKKGKKTASSHFIADQSVTLSSSAPYAETTSGLSVAANDASLRSGTARHLKQVEDYEMENFTRLRMNKRDLKKRSHEEEEVAFGGLGASASATKAGHRRRLGGFGAEFDDLFNNSKSSITNSAYDQLRKAKRPKTENLASENTGRSGSKKKTFERAVERSQKKRSRK